MPSNSFLYSVTVIYSSKWCERKLLSGKINQRKRRNKLTTRHQFHWYEIILKRAKIRKLPEWIFSYFPLLLLDINLHHRHILNLKFYFNSRSRHTFFLILYTIDIFLKDDSENLDPSMESTGKPFVVLDITKQFQLTFNILFYFISHHFAFLCFFLFFSILFLIVFELQDSEI